MNSIENNEKKQLTQLIREELTASRLSDSADIRIRAALNRELNRRDLNNEIMSLEETAQFLNVSVAELMSLIDELPSFEVAGRLRFRRSQLEQWINSREESLMRQKNRRISRLDSNNKQVAGG